MSFEDVTIGVLMDTLGIPVAVFSPLLDKDELDDDDSEEDVEDGPRLELTKD